MNKMYVFAILGMVLVAGSAMAYQGWQGVFHEDVESIVEEGTYADLEALREETGMPMMPWVQDEEDFQAWQERHELMEAGAGPHHGRMRGHGQEGFGRDCMR